MRLLLMADDFTGALDTGVQFVRAGAKTAVYFRNDADFAEDPETEVFIIDTETRHVPAEDAYRAVYELVRKGLAAGITHFYKKTDSGLRGNIGPEITAMADALGRSVTFVPAHPKIGRIVKDGFSWIDGVPISESVFGKDPFEPVRSSKISDLFGEKASTVRILDAENEQDLKHIAENMLNDGSDRAVAGCAGFAEEYAKTCGFRPKESSEIMLKRPVLVICGSINRISVSQVKNAENYGFSTRTLAASVDEIRDVLAEKGCCILENFEDSLAALHKDTKEKREEILSRFSEKAVNVLAGSAVSDLLIIGGDTLYAVLNGLQVKSIRILRELEGGAVLSEAEAENRTFRVVSKSGGFGEERWLTSLLKETGL
ncbi:MAG: hypothetical protein IJL43_06375 [Lachnospiraceae bacterium]|nr:hypothetical protein [Lachnospiraceae bacterium]